MPVKIVTLTDDELKRLVEQATERGAAETLRMLEARLEAVTLESRRARGILTEQQAADVLGISRDTMQRWRRDYEIPTYKVGQQVLYLYDDLVEFVRKNRAA